MKIRAKTLNLLLLAAFVLVPGRLALAQCGGTERWPVKVGSDSDAPLVNVSAPVPISIHDLVRLDRPKLPSDDTTRLSAERIVYVVEGRLLKFKHESGKTGDQDYHLVITDDSLQFSPGGGGTTAVEHSVIAEIVNPDCIPGKQGTPGTTSRFDQQINAMRTRFDQRFSGITGGARVAAASGAWSQRRRPRGSGEGQKRRPPISPGWSNMPTDTTTSANRGAFMFQEACRERHGKRSCANTDNGMLRRMPILGSQENMERGFPDDPQGDAVRLIRIALWRERRHIEKLLKGLLVDINTEIGLLDKRMSAKLEEIDTSVSLVAGELARRSSDTPVNEAGS